MFFTFPKIISESLSRALSPLHITISSSKFPFPFPSKDQVHNSLFISCSYYVPFLWFQPLPSLVGIGIGVEVGVEVGDEVGVKVGVGVRAGIGVGVYVWSNNGVCLN